MRFWLKKPITKREMARAAIPVAALVLVASVVAGRERPSATVVEPAARIDTRIDPRAESGDDLDLSRLARPASEGAALDAAADPFSRRSFAAPATQDARRASAKPVAPPLPFKYVGKMIDGGKLSVFVSRGASNYSLQSGQTIDDYRVDQVTDAAVTFTYLPLKTKQELPITAVN